MQFLSLFAHLTTTAGRLSAKHMRDGERKQTQQVVLGIWKANGKQEVVRYQRP